MYSIAGCIQLHFFYGSLLQRALKSMCEKFRQISTKLRKLFDLQGSDGWTNGHG